MRCASVGSGSKGNALLVEHNDTTVLVDCGFSFAQLKQGIEALGCQIDKLDALFVTHEHGDHIRGLKTFAKKTAIPIYMSYGTAEASGNCDLSQINFLSDNQPVTVGGLTVLPVTVPHDSREPCQFIIRPLQGIESKGSNASAITESSVRALGILTDLGSIPQHVQERYAECDALIIEANHDETMLFEGSYPYSLKQRVGGDWGHLSNRQTAEFIAKLDQKRLQWLVVAHISEQNNCMQILSETLNSHIQDTRKIHYACQQEGFDWLALE